ncbi:TonB dependent receptor [Lacunisphaera limnophila]|uniref:TonB dependent receptor n=1 Tax=Lacunisphaera limnophila TaxID=1838286 RepID=A0A1I7PHB3_9BACT|nr:TonB-dependent receptor [Lacunisphaera limnophila]AOS42988.1 TonB dependent receptor [Lacunisphaera limnophila]
MTSSLAIPPRRLTRLLLAFAWPVALAAQVNPEPLVLPKLSVYSEQVANQAPVSTFAMPVSGLQFEPRVDVQARNLAEGQADVAIRGGIFENTGFKLGALGLFDPQTGHYFAELPVAPAMLTTPRILTGADNAAGGFNAQVGSVAYGWRPVVQRGELALVVGDHSTQRQSLYQGVVLKEPLAGRTLAADLDLARSESTGSIPFGDHEFKRVAGRVQLVGEGTQTDLFAGWQEKFFGWPNLYTPFGFNETEFLQTELYAFNHRAESAPGNFWQVGAYYRRNYDDYEFNRVVPGASNPFIHTTRVRAVAADGRQESGPWAVAYAAQYLRDSLESTSLTFGRFRTREYFKLSVVPEHTRDTTAGRLTLRAGAAYDDTNRDEAAVSPVMELALRRPSGQRLYVQYAESSQVATYTALNSNPAAGLFRGNPNLGRETSRNLEAGIAFTQEAWTVQAAVFHRQDDELVDWTFRNGVVARTANPVDIDTAGLELVAILNTGRYDLILGYTYLEKQADYGAATVTASFYALNFPRHRLTAALVARLAEGLELRVDNEYRRQEKNSLRVIGGNTGVLTSAGIYWRPTRGRGLELSLRVDNLWDDNFQEVPAVPAARRQIAAGAAWHW